MQKWEYLVEWRGITRSTQEMLDTLGIEGWELVAIDDDLEYIFKRPKR